MAIRKRTQAIHELRVPVSERDWPQGPSDASVTLVEYADYQCPTCQCTHDEVEKLLAAQGANLRFVFRHFPLKSLHPRALPAAIAAEAAGRQGKFWQMHGKLFENPGRLEDEDLRRYGQEIGLDPEQFAMDLGDRDTPRHIREQQLEGARSGVNGTPTFFINGRRYEGAFNFEALSAAVEAATHGRTSSSTIQEE